MSICGLKPESELGSGIQAKVYLATNFDGEKVAIKQLYDENPDYSKETLIEIDILNRINHPNLMSSKDTSIEKSGKMCIMMELLDRKSVV